MYQTRHKVSDEALIKGNLNERKPEEENNCSVIDLELISDGACVHTKRWKNVIEKASYGAQDTGK